MTTENQNLQMRAGSEVQITVAVANFNHPRTIAKATYAVIDPDTNQVMLTKVLGSGITATPPPNATVVITLSRADTADLLGEFTHQVRIEDDQQVAGPPIMSGTLTLALGGPVAEISP